MMRGICKDFDTVILNGSDENVVRNITEAIDIVTGERFGKSTSRAFSGDLNIKVVSTTTTIETFKKIQGMIEQSYPGMCIFYAKI